MKAYVESFLELLYPEKNTCFICDAYDEKIKESYICSDCTKDFDHLIPPLCSKCSKPLDYSSSTMLCPDCVMDEKCFEKNISLFSYDGLVKKSIYNYKYHNKPYLYKMFGNMLFEYMVKNNYLDFDFITSVPLHASKMRDRGFNQSELLCVFLSKKLNIPYIDMLKRVKKTSKQSEKSKEQRKISLNDAFTIKKSRNINTIRSKNILLVDDVYTTGSTVNECSKILLKYGVNKVYSITIAR